MMLDSLECVHEMLISNRIEWSKTSAGREIPRSIDDALDKWMTDVGVRWSREWQIEPEQRIQRHEVNAIATLCAFEVVVLNVTEQFCSLFTPFELHMWEFTRDVTLATMHGDLAAQAIVRNKTMPLLSSMLRGFKAIAKAEARNAIRVRVVRSESMISLLALMVRSLELPAIANSNRIDEDST